HLYSICFFLGVFLGCNLPNTCGSSSSASTGRQKSPSYEVYNVILWYKQTKNNQLQLLGHVYSTNPSVEPGVTVTIAGNANKDQTCTLTIKDLTLNSSAVYFCAARYHSATYH
uniref:Immunoglobulin V-set domain-containing protein n=1 Tax=Haplochromis burtoni TaxID=8153 RepID=A0A3Q2VNN2_HAPBU